MHQKFRMVSAPLLSLGLALGLAACGGSSTPANTGQLTVSFTAPGGVSTSATVTGPGGYSTTVTTNTTLNGLAPGTYTISPASVRKAGAIVDEFYDGSVTGGTAAVTNNAAATSSVTFSRRGGSGKLWLPGCENGTLTGTVNGYDASALGASSTPIPAATFATGACAEGTAFDASGNLWVSDYIKKTVSMYTPAQLASVPIPAPRVVLNNPADPTTSFNSPADLTFDKSGNLWVVNFLTSKLVKFTPAQLATSGSPVPSVVLGSTTYGGVASLNGPVGLAFDAGGNLWVGNAYTGGTLVKFAASSLTASGSPSPVAQITDYTTGGGHTLSTVFGLAIDSGGFLWASNFSSITNANRVSKYDVSASSGSGMAAPVTILNMAVGSAPVNIAFDNAGALWVYNSVNSPSSAALLKFGSPSAFSGVLTPTPALTLGGLPARAGFFGRFSFGPAPTALPLLQQK